MSRTKHPRPNIELRAMREALAKLAERCVHAEARATVAEGLKSAALRHIDTLKEKLHSLEWEKRRLWVIMWTLKGVAPKSLIKFRVEYMNESVEEAKRLVYCGSLSYSFCGVDDVPALTVVLPDREPFEG